MDGSLAIIEWIDAFGLDNLEAALNQVTHTPGFHNGMPLLIVEPGTGLGPSPKSLESSAAVFGDFASHFGNKIAMTVSRDVHFGLGRMLEAYCELHGIAFRPFRDAQTARQWLLGGVLNR
ncbi:MAG: hypothetical protein GXP25_14125 [Planctomycetes bacterium]|nr:hypothetical protein [Planctomycetota bacterium]